jgi:outer membrane lipoprotein SlyB
LKSLSLVSKYNKLSPIFFATLAGLVVISFTACSPKPSAEETAAQTKVIVDQAVAESKKEMLVEKSKQDALVISQAEEKAKQDLAVTQAVANAKKEYAADQRKKEYAAEHRAANVKPRAAQSDATPATRLDHPVNAPQDHDMLCANCGTVLAVNAITAEGSGSGLGVVAGGVVGGVLGHQVGSGSGRDLATIAGAVGGAFAGNKIEKVAKKATSYNVVVKMNAGNERTFNQATPPDVLRGDRVKIENNVVIKM